MSLKSFKVYIITLNDFKKLKHNSQTFITLTIFELRCHLCSPFFCCKLQTQAARDILDGRLPFHSIGSISFSFARHLLPYPSLPPSLCLLLCLAKGGNCISCLLCCARESNLMPFWGGEHDIASQKGLKHEGDIGER